MRNHRSNAFFALLTAIMLCAAACGSSTDLSVGAEGEEPAPAQSASESVDLSGRISEQDLDDARLIFDAAKSRWEGRTPSAYTFRAGVESINQIEVEFAEDGTASPERVIFGDANPEGWATVPRSVDEAFDEVEVLLASFEDGGFEVPSAGDCGNHFNVEFDPELGAPQYYDSLGPCDDGVGIRLSVFPEGTAIDGEVVPEQPCNEGEFVGTWLSQGSDVAVELVLADGQSTLTQGDEITNIGEWFCGGSTLIAITNNGEEVQIALINDDGTLTVGTAALSKTEG